MSESLLKWIRPEIRALTAYHVADASDMIKLDAMENPYQLTDKAKLNWQQQITAAELNRYPDPACAALKDVLHKLVKPPANTSMILGNGSDELIQMIAMAVCAQDRCIMSFDPGFVMYRMIAEFVGMQYVGVSLNNEFDIDLDQTLDAIAQHQPAVIFIAYPNNPTANCFNKAAIETIIQKSPGIVVVDEAYHPFAQDSFMPMLADYENLLVMRTVSKMGLAGLRLGFMCGQPFLVNEIDKVRLPYNINVLTQQAAQAILSNTEVLDQQASVIREQRELMLQRLAQFDGVEVFSSQANFILFRLLQHDAGAVFNALKQQGVLIKHMNASSGLLQNCLRVTVGTPEENDMFQRALYTSMQAVNNI